MMLQDSCQARFVVTLLLDAWTVKLHPGWRIQNLDRVLELEFLEAMDDAATRTRLEYTESALFHSYERYYSAPFHVSAAWSRRAIGRRLFSDRPTCKPLELQAYCKGRVKWNGCCGWLCLLRRSTLLRGPGGENCREIFDEESKYILCFVSYLRFSCISPSKL